MEEFCDNLNVSLSSSPAPTTASPSLYFFLSQTHTFKKII